MIRELKTLIAIAREGTFAAAAARVGLTQAAVSAQMQRLQDELGFELFERVGRSVQLNETGRQVLLQAREVVQLYENLGSPATGHGGGALVRIGSIASLQRSLLPDALAGFHRQYRDCRTQIVPGVSLALFNAVDAGELDMAAIIRPPFAMHADLRWTPLAREPFRLIVPRSVPGNDWAGLLETQPFIRYDRASFGGRQVDRFVRQRRLALREVCEVDELDAITKLVANRVGVALVPQTAAQRRWPAAVRAIDLGPHTFHRDVGLVHRALEHLDEPSRALVQILAGLAR